MVGYLNFFFFNHCKSSLYLETTISILGSNVSNVFRKLIAISAANINNIINQNISSIYNIIIK